MSKVICTRQSEFGELTLTRGAISGYDGLLQYTWRLPNGNLHSPNQQTPSNLLVSVTKGNYKMEFHVNGVCYRLNDLPSTINGTLLPRKVNYFWRRGATLHRETGPAVTGSSYPEGQFWIMNEILSREEFVMRYEMMFLKEYQDTH